jgi:hypothetical protein
VGQGHLEPWVQRDALLVGLREASHHAQTAIDAALRRLDGALAGRHWLAGDQFDVADLNVAAVLSPSRVLSIDLRPYEHVGTWLARCQGGRRRWQRDAASGLSSPEHGAQAATARESARVRAVVLGASMFWHMFSHAGWRPRRPSCRQNPTCQRCH